LQFYLDLMNKYRIMPTSAEVSSMASAGGYGSGALQLFANQRGALLSIGRHGYIVFNRINEERRRAGEPELEIAPFPPLGRRRATVVAGARATAVNRRGKHTQEATRFLEFLASKAFNDQLNRASDSVNSVRAYATGPEGITGGRPYAPGVDDPQWVRALESALPMPSSLFIAGSTLNRVLYGEFDRMTNGLQSPAETAARMERTLNQEIMRYVAEHPRLRPAWERAREP
jgi:ABC-type glycerol-3-phosphate transport system substrate-binding protein